MAEVIACPTCSKKYKLPDKPPATFTCKACNTTMDLSGFAPAAPPPPPPPAPPAPLTSSRSGGGRSSSARGRSGARAGARGSRRSRGGGGAGDEDEDDGGGHGRLPPKKGNPALLWGSIGGGVLILGLAILLMTKKHEPAEDPIKVAAAAAAKLKAEADAKAALAKAAIIPEVEAPAAAPVAPAFISMKNIQTHPVEHHPDATAEEKAQIDSLIDKAIFQDLGRDSRDAESDLVKLGVKASPRLINVFHTVKTGEGFSGRPGLVKAQIADRVLRRIDGYIERKVSPRWTPIKPTSDTTWVERIVKHWFFWWDNGKYKTPEKPWDERVDGHPEDAPDVVGGDAPPMDGK